MENLSFKAFAFIAFLITSNAAFSQQTNTKTGSGRDTVMIFKISGITCAGDLKMIADHLQKTSGVSECKQVGKMAPTSAFTVKFDPAKLSYAQVVKTVEATPSCDYPDQHPYKVKTKK